MRPTVSFIIKAAALYCALAGSFSVVGIFLPERTYQASPLGVLSVQEIGGHIIWGLAAGAIAMSMRYFLLAGSFAILIDSDHLIGLWNIETVSRMSHSIAFGIISAIILMLLFGKRNYLLGATAFGGLLAHLSFDVFAGDYAKFPILTPFYSNMFPFPHVDWVFLEALAVAIIGFTTLLTKRKSLQKSSNRLDVK